jgi:hypothetical protein
VMHWWVQNPLPSERVEPMQIKLALGLAPAPAGV